MASCVTTNPWSSHTRKSSVLAEGEAHAKLQTPRRKSRTPNATTIAAMEEVKRGGLRSFASVEELMADLHLY